MQKGLHQLGATRLVRIVALHTIGSGKRLVVMRLLQAGVLRVMTVEAELRRRFGQVISEFDVVGITGFVNGVTSAAAHIQRRVPASFFRNIQANRVTAQAKIFCFVPGDRLQQLLFVRGLMRVVALNAVADGWWMHSALGFRGVLVGVARQTELAAGGRDQFDASDGLGNPDFMATRAAHCDGRVDVRTFALVFMTLQALGCIRVRLKRDRVLIRTQARS
jgi:hypothetical protein